MILDTKLEYVKIMTVNKGLHLKILPTCNNWEDNPILEGENTYK